MLNRRSAITLSTLFCLTSFPLVTFAQSQSDPGKGRLYQNIAPQDPAAQDRSHSHIGGAFDQGPRQFAQLKSGVGNVHFPVTAASPMAQKFFDQGVNLLYGFSWFEAERSFRQAAYLDPDCAMAYWGMAMSDSNRGKEFIAMAQKHEEHITDREKKYIAALAINFRPGDEKSRNSDNIKALEALTLSYPDDVEAKATLAWALYRQQQSGDVSYKTAIDALLKEVLAKNPMHPGAHHFRIHLWDGVGAQSVLDSCKAFSKAAPNVGHALHMPGHIYARLGMWDDAVKAMDASARAERKYFYDEHELPYKSWDYGHDQDFLISCMGYNGRLNEGEALSWELINEPGDNTETGFVANTAWQGRFGVMRMLVRGEKWDEILNGPDAGWVDIPGNKSWVLYMHGLAYLGKGDEAKAKSTIAEIDKVNATGDYAACARQELHGRYEILFGDGKKGLDFLKKAAETEKAKFKYGDPIDYPRPLYEALAWAQINQKQYADAEDTLKEALERNPGSGFALCLKIQCQIAEGKRPEAVETYRELSKAWVHADTDIPELKAVQSLGLNSEAHVAAFPTPYRTPSEVTREGPARWQPFPAPEITVQDKNGSKVRLSDFRGHNVILIFTLGGSCPRCNKQLEDFGKEASAFAAMDTKLISVSNNSAATIKAYLAGNPEPPIQILSDPQSEAARAFRAHDDFENLDLHATVLIDKQGRVWWYQTGVEPFTNIAFLKGQIARMDAWKPGMKALETKSGKKVALNQP